jgi:hypothetical protein
VICGSPATEGRLNINFYVQAATEEEEKEQKEGKENGERRGRKNKV